jgi:hypothetical protein
VERLESLALEGFKGRLESLDLEECKERLESQALREASVSKACKVSKGMSGYRALSVLRA